MIKIAHIITDLDIGGAETMLFKLLGAIDKSKFNNIVICMLGKGRLGDSIKNIGVPVYTLNMSRGRPGVISLFRLFTMLKRERPDIVQTWLYHADLFGTIVGKLAGIRIIIWNLRCSNLDPAAISKSTILIMRILAFLSNIPNAIIVNSIVGKEVHKKVGYRIDRLKVIFNGFDTAKFRPDHDAKVRIREELGVGNDTVLIGLIARFDPMKDHDTFIKAAGILLNKYPDVHFVMAGNRVDLKNTTLYDKVRAVGIPGNFHLLGERNDVAEIMASLDLFTLSSVSEGFPNVVAEAMSCGIPYVGTNVGDLVFLADRTGLTVPIKDPEALAHAWEKMILMGQEERRKAGLMARKRIESFFSICTAAAHYENLYLGLTKKDKLLNEKF